MTVTITWTDGSRETWRCGGAHVTDGVLRLTGALGEPDRNFPLVGVRTWTEQP